MTTRRSHARLPERHTPGRTTMAVACLTTTAALACASPTDAPGRLPENADLSREWPVASPDAQGMDTGRLSVAYQIARGQPHLKSLLVVRNGFLVAEEYFGADEDTTVTNIHAATKSFMSALVGIAIDAGFIEGVDQPIETFLVPEVVASLAPEQRAITIRHLLTMTSGIEWQEETDLYAAPGDDALWEYLLSKPVTDEPGSRINYNTAAAGLLSVILTHATGMETLAFARQVLFAPLGIDSLGWRKDGDYWFGGSFMHMRPRDMAKLGALYVNGGVSNGRTVVPAAWISQSLAPITALGVPYRYGPIEHTTYGFLWWLDRQPVREAFFAWGWGGQFIYCVPSLKLVVVTTTDAPVLTAITRAELEKALLDLIIDRVLPAVTRL